MRWTLLLLMSLGCSDRPLTFEASAPALGSTLSAVAGARLNAAVATVTSDLAIDNLCAGRADLVIVDRPLTVDERARCTGTGRPTTELPFGQRTLGLIVSSDNSWAYGLSLSEVRRLFSPRSDGKVVRWDQLRPGWPAKPLRLVVGAIDSDPLQRLLTQLQPGAPGIRTDVQAVGSRVVNRVWRDRYAIGFADTSTLPIGVRALNCDWCNVASGHVIVATERSLRAARQLIEARR
ncbi:MAG: ABC-type phosphate transport system substrate-binding protein [Myxococcota bacterium]|jgi:ABC-type phosphate transport system substrate-binding protein